jgi:hypothetical protein
MSFIPSWILRDARDEVIVPKVLLTLAPLAPATNPVFGYPRFTWLSRLKASARNCTFSRSFTVVFLMSEKSKLKNPGFRTSGSARTGIDIGCESRAAGKGEQEEKASHVTTIRN